MTTSVALLATFTAREGRSTPVAELLRDYGEVVRREPGNLVFDAHQVDEHPESFVIYEVYRDEHAFRDHLEAAAGRDFNAALIPQITEPASRLTFLRPLAQPRAPRPVPGGGTDDDPATQKG